MFVRLTRNDAVVVSRGLLALAIIIVLGVAAAESQLNTLTEQSEFVKAFNIRQEAAGAYTAYMFGQQRSVSSAVTVGTIANAGSTLLIGVGGHNLAVPTATTLDLSDVVLTAKHWLDLWYGQFIAEAWRTKQELAEIAAFVTPYLKSLSAIAITQLQRLLAEIQAWYPRI
jgi:hypothetical protein